MLGKDLIKWIQDHKAEDLPFFVKVDNVIDIYSDLVDLKIIHKRDQCLAGAPEDDWEPGYELVDTSYVESHPEEYMKVADTFVEINMEE